MLQNNALSHVRYTKADGEVTDRKVLLTFVPAPKHQNVKAIDVTGLSEADAEKLQGAWIEYQEYLENQRKTLFAFEDFVAQTLGDSPEIKWRTFKPAQLEEME